MSGVEAEIRQAVVLVLLTGAETEREDDDEAPPAELIERLVVLAERRRGSVVAASQLGAIVLFPEDGSAARRALDLVRVLRPRVTDGLGLSAGPVTLSPWSRGRTAHGAAVEQATRLARAPGVRLTPEVAGRLQRQAVLQAEEGDVWRLVDTHSEELVTPGIGGAPLPFVGRAAELEHALGAMAQALGGSGRPLLVRVRGASGVGATRFLAELAARAASAHRGLQVLSRVVGPTELGDAEALASLGLLAARTRPGDTDEVAERRVVRWTGTPHGAAALVRMARLGADGVPGPERSAALLATLNALEGPTLLLLDGASELSALRAALGERQSGAPLVVVAAGAAVSSGAFPCPTVDIALAPLSLEELEVLVRAALSQAVDVPRWVVRDVARAAEGLPVLVDELLLGLAARGVIDTQAVPWRVQPAPEALQAPPGAEHLAVARLDRLTPRARRAAEAVAVLGGASSPAALSALGVADASARLDELVDAGVLLRLGERWDFAKPALPTVLLRALPQRRARRLHLAAAESLLARDTRGAAMVAQHLAAAGLPERALPYAERAAAEASDQPGLPEAVARSAEALRLAESAGEPAAVGRCRVRLAEQLRRAGQLERAEALAASARDEAGDPALAASAALVHGWVLEHRGRLEAAETAFAVARRYPATARSATAGLAALATKRGGEGLALVLLDEAAELPGLAGVEGIRLDSTLHRLRGHALLRLGQTTGAEAEYHRAERLAFEGGAAEEQVDALNGLGALHFFAQAWSSAEAVFRDALAAAGRWDLVHVEGYVLTNLAETLLASGRPGEAAEQLETALQRHLGLANDEGVAESARLLAEARLALGEPAAARTALGVAQAAASRVGSAYALGEVSRVAALLGRAV